SLVVPVLGPGLPLKREPHRELNQSRILRAAYLSKGCSVRDVPIRIQELGVIEQVENLASELQAGALTHRDNFVNGKVQIGRAPAAAEGARRIADLAQGSIDERGRIEVVAPGFWRIETPEGRNLVWFAGCLEVGTAHQLPIAAGSQTNRKARLQCANAAEGPSIRQVASPIGNSPFGNPPVLTHHEPMARVKQGRGTRLSRVDRIHGVFETGSVVEGSAPGVGGQKLQAVRETLVHQSLERVVGRVGDRHLSEDAAEHGNPVRRTTGARGGFAERRCVLAKSNQRNRIGIWTGHGRDRSVGQMHGDARRNGTGGNGIGIVRSEWTARQSRDLIQVETGLWGAEILVQDGQEPVSLRTNVSKLPERVSGQLALHGDVIMDGVLIAQRAREIAEETDRTKEGEIHRGAGLGVQKSVEGIGRNRTVLAEKRGVQENVANRSAAPERWLGREIFTEEQFLVAVVEHSPSQTDAGLARPAGDFGQPTLGPARRPSQAQPRGESSQVVVGESRRHSRISWKNHTQGEYGAAGPWRGTVAAADQAQQRVRRTQDARIDSGGLARTESLNAVPGVGLRCVPLPAQSVIEGKVGPQFPGVLGKQVKLHGADVDPVCRTLRIGVWETEEIVGYETAEPDVVGTASIEKESPTDVIKVQLIQALVADIDAELQRMLTQYPAIGVQGLINVSCLGEVSRSVVAKSKATRQRHKGNALVPGAVPGCDSKAGVCRIAKTLVGGDDHARILHQIGARRREQLALPVPVIDKPGLVNGL